MQKPTKTQYHYYEAYREHGSYTKTAKALGKNYSTIRTAVRRVFEYESSCMDFKLSDELFKKALSLKSQHENKGETLREEELQKKLQINEAYSEYLLRLLNDLPTIASSKDDINDHVKLTSNLSTTKAELKDAKQEIERLARLVELNAELKSQTLHPPKWLLPDPSKKKKAIACAQLSDVHADEYVDPASFNFVNKYNREICTQRLQAFFRNQIRLGRDYCAGVDIEGAMCSINGDIVSGTIHDELRETNEFQIAETILYYAEILSAGLRQMVEHYKKLFVVCTVGNHGRFGQKVKHKGAVKDNWDYLLYHLIAKELNNEAQITFYIPDSPDAYFPIYDTVFAQTHGNQFRGGQGWMGPLGPAMRGDRKKRERQQQLSKPYDVLLMGHFHTYIPNPRLIMNGSVVGYNEFASNGNFGYERPQQAFWLTVPEHGVTMTTPIRCESKEEDWRVEPVQMWAE